MGRIVTWLLVAAVAAVAVAAAVSAFVGDSREAQPSASEGEQAASPAEPAPSEAEPAAPSPVELPSQEADVASAPLLPDASELLELIGSLRTEGLRGMLYVSDAECSLHALSLPDLDESRLSDSTTCRFAVEPGEPPAEAGVARRAGTELAATCRRDRVEVVQAVPGTGAAPDAPARPRLRGCAPAWKPDGTLTLVRDGELLSVRASCQRPPERCVDVLLSREALERAFAGRSIIGRLRQPEVTEAAWLSDDSFIAILAARSRSGETVELAALFRGGAFVDSAPLVRPDLALVRVSPDRTYVAIRAGESEGMFVVRPRADGLAVDRFPPWAPPAPTDIRAIAWSPDERWTAVASRRFVYVFRTGKAAPRFLALPFSASDIAWGSAELLPRD